MQRVDTSSLSFTSENDTVPFSFLKSDYWESTV